MIYKGGEPPLMICTTLRVAMPYGDMMHLLRKYDVARCTRDDAMFAHMCP